MNVSFGDMDDSFSQGPVAGLLLLLGLPRGLFCNLMKILHGDNQVVPDCDSPELLESLRLFA